MERNNILPDREECLREIRVKEFGLLKKNQKDKLELDPAGPGKSCEGVWTLIRAVSDRIQFLF